jgi:large subunit ribosomal protein L24
MKLKKGDKVIVIAGKSRGKTGSIVRVMPKAQSRAGQIVEKPMPLHASNVMLVDPKDGKPTRIKISRAEGGRTRVAVKSGQTV